MNDTPSELSQLLSERYTALTPAERVRMAASMFGTAVALARAGIRAQDASATESEVRERLLRRLYAAELSEEQLVAISRSWIVEG